MSNHRFSLENNIKRTCPNCEQKTFVIYINNETGKSLGESVGRCDRESKCGYHYTPKQFFADNTQVKAEMFGDFKPVGKRQRRKVYAPVITAPKSFDVLTPDVFERTLRNYRENGLAKYLLSLIEESDVLPALKNYAVGTWTRGETVFWQIDSNFQLRTGQIIAYNSATGKRIRDEFSSNWVHAALKKRGEISDDFQLEQTFFGSHLLPNEPGSPVAIVESCKTAVIASIFVPGYIWLACIGKSYLNLNRLRKLAGRKIVLFPDADGFDLWSQKAVEATRVGLDVSCSDLIEAFATTEEKRNGFDLADYLLSAKISERENSNRIIDEILNDSDLRDAFDERMAICEFDGNLEPETVESPQFVRDLAAYIHSK